MENFFIKKREEDRVIKKEAREQLGSPPSLNKKWPLSRQSRLLVHQNKTHGRGRSNRVEES